MEALKTLGEAREAAAAAANGHKRHDNSASKSYSDIVQGNAPDEGSRSASKIHGIVQGNAADDASRSASKSYSDIVQGNTNSQLATVHDYVFIDPATVQFSTVSEHQGLPSITFSTSAKLQLVNNLQWVLVGKFSHGKPQLSVIQAFFKSLQLQGDVNCALSDSKHLFIECSCYVDYYWIWMQLVLTIQGYSMRLFKWEPNFSALIESPIAPVWIRIVGLALYLFDERSLLRIASIIGKPIKVDSRNINRTCLSYARVCVELDVSKPLIEEIGITIVDDETGAVVESKKAQILYDVVPKYCPECSHIGHTSTNCKRNIGSYALDATKSISTAVVSGKGRSKQVWQQVRVRSAAGANSVSQNQGGEPALQGLPLTERPATGQGSTLSKEPAAAGQGIVRTSCQQQVPVLGTSDSHHGEPTPGIEVPKQATTNVVDSFRLEESDAVAAALSSDMQDTIEGQVHASFGQLGSISLQPKIDVGKGENVSSGQEQLAQDANQVQRPSTNAEQQEPRVEAGLVPKSPKEDEWQVVVSKNKRGSREKTSATASAPKNISNRLVFDHNIQDVRSGHSEPRQIQLLRPSWADQVEEECELPTLQQTVPNTTEDIGEDSDWRAFIKAHFLESSASIEAALRKKHPRPQQVAPKDSMLGTGMEQVEKGHESATKESKEDLHTTRGEDKPRHVHFHELVTMHTFEKEVDRRSERLTPKNTPHTEKDFKVRVLDDQHHEGWPLTVSQGKHAHTPGTKAKSNDPG